ncbi:hypothetical protein B0T17DRAFT_527252, partial [Bombardia bombarda]
MLYPYVDQTGYLRGGLGRKSQNYYYYYLMPYSFHPTLHLSSLRCLYLFKKKKK